MPTQTGSIDLRSSGAVRLYAKAGFDNADETYATKSELEVQADKISMVVDDSTTSSSLVLTPEAITAVADNFNVNGRLTVGAISDLEVGGRNLLCDTNSSTLTKMAGPGNRYFSDNSSYRSASIVAISDPPVPAIEYGGRISTTSTSYTTSDKKAALCSYSGVNVPMIEGEKYTFSFWARKVSGTCAYYCQVGSSPYMQKNGSNYYSDANALGTSWERIVYTFTYTSATCGGTGGCRVYPGIVFKAQTEGVGEVCGMKLERGTVATEWSPAPEDLDAGIADAAKTATNYIEADEDGIKIFDSAASKEAGSYQHQTASATEFYVDGTLRNRIDANGMVLTGDDDVTLAMFTADDAVVGAPGSTQLSLSSGELVGRTPQGLEVFTADLDVGTVTETTKKALKTSTNISKSIAAGVTYLVHTSTSLSYAGSGATAVWKSGEQEVKVNFITSRLKVRSAPSVASGSNVSVVNWTTGIIILNTTADLTQTVGTSSSKTYYVDVPATISDTTDVTIRLQFTREMSGSVAVMRFGVTNGSNTAIPSGSIPSVTFSGYFPEVTVSAQAPAFMLGDRYGSPGMYSAALGRGLRAASDYQAVVGKYNVADSSDAYAFIVGNGTAATRSNAFTVAWDGSIDSKTFTTTTISDTISAASGVTINECSFAQWGKLAMLFVKATPSSAKSGDWTIGTVVSGKRPPFETPGDSHSSSTMAFLNSSGALTFRGSVSANASCWAKVVYIIS